ncbi:MAG: GntR family transcriptional regulator [Terriglobales bacterium]|jgi:GntR family transcriptional regulator / MocR family aminotransferase
MGHRREFVVPPIDLDRASKVPLHRQIYHQIAGAIRSRSVHCGARLPSTRVMARLLRVSRNTVLVAYDDLAADNLIRGKRGAGMWVNGDAPVDLTWLRLRHVIRAAGYPTRILTLADPDGNPLYIRA